MVEKFSRDLNIQGAEAIIGEMPDYVELASTHFDETGVRLFGKDYGFDYARTITPTGGTDVASVGHFCADDGLGVCDWDRDDGGGGLFVAPLVVPKP